MILIPMIVPKVTKWEKVRVWWNEIDPDNPLGSYRHGLSFNHWLTDIPMTAWEYVTREIIWAREGARLC